MRGCGLLGRKHAFVDDCCGDPCCGDSYYGGGKWSEEPVEMAPADELDMDAPAPTPAAPVAPPAPTPASTDRAA
jgi:hypothetical protein